MKTVYYIIAFLFAFGQVAFAQSDTLVGVLRDANNKVIKRQEVVLGKDNPIKVKTDKYGIFTIPKANLNDTLYIFIKKEKREIKVPVNGHNVVNVLLVPGSFNAERKSEPDEYIVEIMGRGRNKLLSSSVLYKSDIEKSRCLDMECLLRRISGVQVNGSQVSIRGVSSINSGTAPLLVLNGSPTDISLLFTIRVESIEYFEVLKEASIYGVRGANGVIIVKTTK